MDFLPFYEVVKGLQAWFVQRIAEDLAIEDQGGAMDRILESVPEGSKTKTSGHLRVVMWGIGNAKVAG